MSTEKTKTTTTTTTTATKEVAVGAEEESSSSSSSDKNDKNDKGRSNPTKRTEGLWLQLVGYDSSNSGDNIAKQPTSYSHGANDAINEGMANVYTCFSTDAGATNSKNGAANCWLKNHISGLVVNAQRMVWINTGNATSWRVLPQIDFIGNDINSGGTTMNLDAAFTNFNNTYCSQGSAVFTYNISSNTVWFKNASALTGGSCYSSSVISFVYLDDEDDDD